MGLVAVPTSAAQGMLTATFTERDDWGSGFEGKFTLHNGTAADINGWTVEFDMPAGFRVTSSWDAGQGGTPQHPTFSNPGWAAVLRAGGTASFGFIGTPGNFPGPLNCKVNGADCAGGPVGPAVPGTPGTPTVTSTTDTSISLSWTAASGDVTGYKVYSSGTMVEDTTTTSATITGLTACTSHAYTVTAYNDVGESPHSATVSATTSGCTPPTLSGAAAAPYFGAQWDYPPSPAEVMAATGIKWFTLNFLNSDGTCNALWDGNRPLFGGKDELAINEIRGAGGDFMPSFGGATGQKLGLICQTPEALAAVYQEVIDAFQLKVIDVDIEGAEFENEAAQDRILNALRIIEQNNPGIEIIVTMPTTASGPNWWGTRMITQAKALGADVNVWSTMTFNFGGGPSTDMYNATIISTDALKNFLKSTFGWSDAEAYAHTGISGMNGLSDNREPTSVDTWTRLRDWAKERGLARFTFWSLNRDNNNYDCEGLVLGYCSGIDQTEWAFTRVTAGY
ncbi:cellulose binding domain-containing protein [Actinophytocola sp.]|uniref:cellulose binding domain-containing protein n=1 Tax=Actinophytocola sp. TaxID=1872138 RepID=UPI002D7E9D3D|nr:cellulose binding domain-containing protein [Actinophytocola sp.]HET9140184.1 cellulose binding domain-containing protein [Actinophytocola sp.]